MRLATVIPLDYQDRVENSIIYCTNDWSELEKLLTSPDKWLYHVQQDFEQDAENHVDWDLLSPPIVLLEPLRNNFHAFATVSNIVNEGLERGGFSVNEMPVAAANEATLEDDSKRWHDEIRKGFFQKGGFLCEFAAGTRVLNVRYVEPKREAVTGEALEAKTTRLASERRFKGHVTPATISRVSDTVGALHVDMKPPKCTASSLRATRAHLVMDFIEDRERIIDLTQQAVTLSKTKMATVFTPTDPKPARLPDKANFIEMLPLSEKGAQPVPLADGDVLHASPNFHPTILLEYPEDGPLGCVCCQTSLVRLNRKWFIGGLELKLYTCPHPCPDPPVVNGTGGTEEGDGGTVPPPPAQPSE
jgi:hypothetical protein